MACAAPEPEPFDDQVFFVIVSVAFAVQISRVTFRLQDAEHEVQRLRDRNAELAGAMGKLETRLEQADAEAVRQRMKTSEAGAIEAEKRELDNRLAVTVEERDVLRQEVSQLTMDCDALRRKVRGRFLTCCVCREVLNRFQSGCMFGDPFVGH